MLPAQPPHRRLNVWPALSPEAYLTVKLPTPDGDLERQILHPA
jgi:hypothetical protein